MRSKTWCLSGGRLNEGEDWNAALVRKVKEETNLDCEVQNPFAVHILKDEYRTKYRVYFTVDISNPDDFTMSREHSHCRWIGREEAGRIRFEGEKIREVFVSYFSDPSDAL